MPKLIYVDTNIYIDFFEDRIDNLRLLGEIARQLFDRALDCEFTLVVSSLVNEEIKDNGYKTQFIDFLADFKKYNKVIYTELSEEDKRSANELKRFRKTPFKDTCHLILAQRLHAEVLVTRNVKDYVNISDIIPVLLPEFI